MVILSVGTESGLFPLAKCQVIYLYRIYQCLILSIDHQFFHLHKLEKLPNNLLLRSLHDLDLMDQILHIYLWQLHGIHSQYV